MCGIFFINNYKQDDNYIIEQFLKCSNRGPDSTRYLKVKNNFIGFHRLSINGLNSGFQPFNKKGIYLICNGEIYNHKELYFYMKQSPETESDCEVIIDMYLKYGIEYTVIQLDGVFAFVLYDTGKNLVYGARDPFGIRPLYYFNANPSFGFASNVASLVNLNTKINYFPPGSYCRIENNIQQTRTMDFHFKKYFNLTATSLVVPSSITHDYNFYKNLVKNALTNAVRKRLMTDRPIACLLSGGLDSSLITSIVVKLSSVRVKTFAIGLKESTDLVKAKIVADFLGTEHTNIILTEEEFFNCIPEVIKKVESYDTTTIRASVGNYLVSKYIAENTDCKVIFNGDGSDELCGGYLYFNSSPSKLDSEIETIRLLQDIYMFDVLRSDKTISSCGLEPRTPFLDKTFVSVYRNIPIHQRFYDGEIEKKLLRDSFVGYLPESILYRKKEAFSDGVSSENRSWYQIISEKLKYKNIPPNNYISNQTKEKNYYFYIYQTEFPHQEHLLPYYWMPKWVNTTDPSARTIKSIT